MNNKFSLQPSMNVDASDDRRGGKRQRFATSVSEATTTAAEENEEEDGKPSEDYESPIVPSPASVVSSSGPFTAFSSLYVREVSSTTTTTTDLESGSSTVEDDDSIEMFSTSERERQLQQQQQQLPHPSYDYIESLVAQEMAKLSMKDREAVYYDIHGVSDVFDENFEVGFVDRKLSEMSNELQKLNLEDRKAYEMARNSYQDYVDNRDFRLRFLRSERFDEKLAAIRYARHYQVKRDLFGFGKVGRDITQDDLDDEALEALYCGTGQILPRRDSAGRLLWFYRAGEKNQSFSEEALMQRMFYNQMMASEDVETQQKGNVVIAYALNQQQKRKGSNGTNAFRKQFFMMQSAPLLILSFHCCYDNYAWVPVLSILKFSSQLFMRLRVQSHFGDHQHCMFELSTFGIPIQTIPIDENGTLHTARHKMFYESRRLQERKKLNKGGEESNPQQSEDSSVSKEPKILVAASGDVLLGRGSGYFNHYGNRIYRGLIEERSELYDRSSKSEKKKIAEEVVAIIENIGGRFLRGEDGSWIQIDRKAKMQKIGHSFRALRSNSTSNTNTTAPPSKRMTRD